MSNLNLDHVDLSRRELVQVGQGGTDPGLNWTLLDPDHRHHRRRPPHHLLLPSRLGSLRL
jgi:hypothetical protein